MGFLNVIVNEDLYDHDFVEQWTNAPFLIRSDTDKILRASEVVEGESDKNFAAWDSESAGPVIWDVGEARYAQEGTIPVLHGDYEVTLVDGKTIQCHTVWDAFCSEVSEYPTDRVEAITGVPQDDIRAAARFFAQSKPAAIHWGLPIDSTPGITPTAMAITDLWCLTGNLEKPGGNIVARHAFEAVAYALPGAEGAIKLATPEMDEPRIGADKYGPFKQFIWRAQTDSVLEQILSEEPYPIKGIWLQTSNLIAGIGFEPKKWRDAFKKLDFVAAVDLFMTPKAISVDGCRPDVEINFELAKRFDPSLRWETVHELFDDILEPSGMTFKELQERGWAFPPDGHPSAPYNRHERGLLRHDGKPGFHTPTGKVELYSVLRENWGFEPIAHYDEPPFTAVSRPDLAEEYPLILNTGRRSAVYFNAEHRNIPWLRELDPDPTLEIHPDTAADLDIRHGDWVWVENWLGKQKFKAKVTIVVPPEMVMAAHGWWFPEKEPADPSNFGVWESNVNQLIPMGSQGKDGLGAPLKNLLCKVYKA
jgi:anaerobic selenocysteine-containing dehydrogenase